MITKGINATSKESFVTRLVSRNNYNEVVENTTIPGNSYAWNDTYSAFHVNSSTGTSGIISFPLGHLEVGDTVEVEVQYWSIIGAKPICVIDYRLDDRMLAPNGSSPQIRAVSEVEEGFKTLKATITSEKTSWAVVSFGVITNVSSEFYIRDVSVTMKSRSGLNVPQKEVQKIKHYSFASGASGFALQTNRSWDTCTIQINSSAKTMVLMHDVPFKGTRVGTSHANAFANSTKYDVVTASESYSSITLRFIDRNTNDYVDPATITTPAFWFNVMHIGYDVI